MARIRSVKPEFWADERVAMLSPMARLLFIGTWNLADDTGVLRWNPEYLKASLFMYDRLNNKKMTALMDEVAGHGLVLTYVADVAGHQVLAKVINFARHQRISKPQKSLFPAPPETSGAAPDSATVPRPFRDRSAQEGKGAGNGGEGISKHQSSSEPQSRGEPNTDDDHGSGTTHPQGGALADVWRLIAEAELADRLLPGVVAERGAVGDERAWLASAVAGADAQHAEAAAKLTEEHPDWSPARLAAELEHALFANNPAVLRENALDSARNFGAMRAGIVDADDIPDEIASQFGDDELQSAALEGWRAGVAAMASTGDR